MATYTQVKNKIIAALTGRPSGTLVQAPDLQAAEIAILDFVVSSIAAISGSSIRSAHGSAIADTNCDLVWNTPFADTNYDFSPFGYDAEGSPVEIIIIAKAADKLTVKTFVNATLTSTAVSY